ncbi:MAG: hypothetical protein E6J12_02845 [Chloroflexi bacterium]|nr:MAG: hypothetical protein E6J12_02845 [Chloroflexota bacterium]
MIFADPAREADDEATDGRVFEEQAELVDHEHPPSLLALDPCPQRLREQKVHRSNHLVAQLTHAEGDDRGLEVDVGGAAEHLSEAALNPAAKNRGGTRGRGQAFGHIA